MQYDQFVKTPLNIGEQGLRLEIPPGMTLTSLAKTLKQEGVLTKSGFFRWTARLHGMAQKVKAGEYEFPPGTKPLDFLEKIVAGKVIQYSQTIVEGWTYKQMMEAVNNNPHLIHSLLDLNDQQVMERLGLADEHPEGRFLPDTYFFPKGTMDVEFLKRAYAAQENLLAEEWQNRLGALPYKKPYDALILASIVEKETALPSERQAIAGVFIRRLEKGMRLQTDPTVIYGLGDTFDGNLRRRDLKKNTPYNTYVRKGLPPTPIALPGRDSIHAALHPDQSEAIYFVSRGDGSHEFSDTLQQHNKAVRKYQLNSQHRRNHSRSSSN